MSIIMKTILMLASAGALAFTGAAAHAKPPHAGQGKGRGAAMAHHGRDIARGMAGQHGFGSQYGYGLGGCPPGLAKKNPPCIPPGLARQQFQAGQRLPLGYASPFGYNQIPYDLRSQYGLNPYGNYYYGNGHLYQVDPKTMLIQQVIAALLR